MSKLQQATMMFIVSQLMTEQEKRELKKTFLSLDKDANGTLTKEELMEGYTLMYGSKERAEAEVKELMAKADIDMSGSIDYSGILSSRPSPPVEFLVAAANKKIVASREHVKAAFDLFDSVL